MMNVRIATEISTGYYRNAWGRHLEKGEWVNSLTSLGEKWQQRGWGALKFLEVDT